MQGIGQEFMEKTRHQFLAVSGQRKGVPAPPLEVPHDASQPTVELPPPNRLEVAPVILRELIEARRSVREYAGLPVSLEELSYLLWCTQGVKEVVPGRVTLRTVPSAGARHAFETYLLVNRVERLAPGLYRFLAVDHQLAEIVTHADIADTVTRACFGQDFVMTGAVTFIWSAVPYRMAWRYSQRAYRYLHLDAGHVCQNLYLAAESVGCGVCAIAAFDDEALAAALGLDGTRQFPIYLASLGRKPKAGP
ncbi:MAG: SagB/ThcOx family dehydrogenase [Phycisphaerae bacterium]